jgi:hypothetical protein
VIDLAGVDHPDLRFEVGPMTDLIVPDASLTGLLAWQSLIHILDEAMTTVPKRFHLALRPGKALRLLRHVGDEPPSSR